MASDAGKTGSGAYIKFVNTVLSTNYRNFNSAESEGIVDQSAGADTGVTYLTTLRDGTFAVTVKHKAGDTAVFGALVPGTEGTLEWAEEGTTATYPKHTVNAILTGRNQTAAYADLIVIDFSFQFSDNTGVVDGTY